MTHATKPTHGGKRPGSGRKPAPLPLFTKAFRATPERQEEFYRMLTSDAAKDFDLIFELLKQHQTHTTVKLPLTSHLPDPETGEWKLG